MLKKIVTIKAIWKSSMLWKETLVQENKSRQLAKKLCGNIRSYCTHLLRTEEFTKIEVFSMSRNWMGKSGRLPNKTRPFPRRSNIQERSVINEADQRIDRKRLSWKNAEKHKTESIKAKNVQKKSYEPDKSEKKDVENLVCPIERKTTKISDKLNTIQRL